MKTEHILIIRFSPLSDVVMTAPVVMALATQYPDIRVTMLSCEEARPLFERMPQNVGFMSADLKNEYYGVKGLNALYRRLTAKNFTAIADFHCILKSEYLRLRFNIDRFHVAHVDKHRSMRRQLTARSGKNMTPMPHVYSSYADVLGRLGYPVDLTQCPDNIYKGIETEPLPQGINIEKLNDNAWIGIAPFGGFEGKTYPLSRLEQAMCILAHSRSGARVLLFAEKEEEKAVLDEWCQRHSFCVNASRLEGGLHTALALISRLNVMVTMDNLFMHLASVAQVPLVSVWGATHPYGGHTGWRQQEEGYVQCELPCRPCSIHGRKNCLVGGYPCMANLSPEQIAARAEQLMK